MMLGKRQRPPMKKTTSMTEFTLDLSFTTAVGVPPQPAVRINRRNSVEYFTDDSAHFLKFCSLCNRRLIPGRDIFMYSRGDSGFCSSECRQQQIIQDERKEKAAACLIATHTNNIESSSSSAAASSISIAAGSEITEPISTAVI